MQQEPNLKFSPPRNNTINYDRIFSGKEGVLEAPSSINNNKSSNTIYKSGYKIIEDNDDEYNEGNKLLNNGEESFTNVGYNPFVTQNIKKQQLSTTFMHMEYRKLKRASSGSYRDNPRGKLWIIGYICIFAAYLTYQFYYMNVDKEWDSADLWKEVILETLLTIVLGYTSVRLQTLAISLTLFWIYILVTGFFLLTQNTFRFLLISDIICIICTWIGHILYYYIGPYILRESKYCFGWRRVKSRIVKCDEEKATSLNNLQEIVFEYRPLSGVLTCSSPNTFIYRGEWKDGRPNGWGEWRDDSFYGESLSGFWENGIPRGPFESVERGTGNMFSCVAIGYCSMRNADWKCQPFKEIGKFLTYGMAYEECAISGGYYLNFPIHTEVKNIKFTCECSSTKEGINKILPFMDHSDDKSISNTITISTTNNGLDIFGYQPLSPESQQSTLIECIGLQQEEENNINTDDTPIQINIEGWELSTIPEVLIFIHGYNIPLDWAMKKLGQLVAAGKFPPHIKPFVFSWPTGKIFYYFQSIKVATSTITMDCFYSFLCSIQASGVKKIHIITHSMGIKLFIKALNTPKILDLFSQIHSRDISNSKLDLITSTFTNADYSVKDFRNTDYSILRNICDNISIYADKHDDALKYSSIFTNTLLIGRLSTPFYSDSNATQLLDLDIMDTSGLQDNMHSVRHSAFNVNRMMVEDLREIIVSRKRASERSSRLVNKKGNFYCFMTTPAAVTGNIV